MNAPTPPFPLVASDLDGTLLNRRHTVDALTVATLRDLDAQGVRLVLATGRHHLDAAPIRARLGVRAHLITANGARVHDEDDRLIARHDLEPGLARELLSRGLGTRTLLSAYLDDEWLIERPFPMLLTGHRDSGFRYRVADLRHHDGNGISKILYMGGYGRLLKLEAQLLQRYDGGIALAFSSRHCLEVMARGVSKGRALSTLLDTMGIAPERCVAFGDGQNDIEMLQAVGFPQLMANAQPRLQQSLPGATRVLSNADSGVARRLRELFGRDA
ncbi:Cof-type HAD-IIB family hydrolase [Paludibacterium yongneupense]|uniref:Cof-type HAD-IIB family hydrolase n=1 Tax=Paludibacterium yongneupense TaxID=400061 RepID=UPI000428238B|nr:Cof-type HAD-IIB family hydrolase [Paludibacterium yongneupense]